MKKLVKVEEVEGEGLIFFMGGQITLFCDTYIYTGVLEGVNDQFVKLNDPKIVYETGNLKDKVWKLSESLPSPHYVMIGKIESFGPGK